MERATIQQLRSRIHLVLGLALAVSVAANVAAAEATVTGRLVAAWPPVALLLVVDVLGRVPRSSGWPGRLSVVATGLVAGVAGVASFSHMRSVAVDAGESELVAWLFPLTVDGLAVVCSIALVELGRRASTAVTDSGGGVGVSVEPSARSGGGGLTVQRSSTDTTPAPRVLVPLTAVESNGHSSPERNK